MFLYHNVLKPDYRATWQNIKIYLTVLVDRTQCGLKVRFSAYKEGKLVKRYGYLYEKICSMDNLYLAFQNAKKGKGWYAEVKLIEKRPYYYLAALQWMLKNHLYKTSEYAMFTKKDGKKEREIYKLPFFPDRIAQWAVLQVIEP